DGMDHGRSREVMKSHSERLKKVPLASHRGEKSIGTPRPMPNDGIDESRHRNAVQKVANKAGPADHRTGCNRRAGVRKRELEEPKRKESNAARFVCRGRALQEKPVISDEAIAVAEHEGEAKSEEQQPAETRIDDTLH